MREICKAGLLQQKGTTSKTFLYKVTSKKTIYLPEKWYVFCIHDDRVPFLETYGCENEISRHLPHKVLDLCNCSYISRAVEDERTFVIGFDDVQREPLELTALNPEERKEWIEMLTVKLTALGFLPPADNTYGPVPYKSTLTPTRLTFAVEPDVAEPTSSSNDFPTEVHEHYAHLFPRNSADSNGVNDDDERQLYEPIGGRNRSTSVELPSSTNASVHGNNANLTRQSSQKPPLPPRNPHTNQLFVKIDASNNVDTMDGENPYSSAPIYHPICVSRGARRTTSSSSEYDLPSPRLPPAVPPPPTTKLNSSANNFCEEHLYENEQAENLNERLKKLDPSGRYADVLFPPRPVVVTSSSLDNGCHDQKFSSSTSSEMNNVNVNDQIQQRIVAELLENNNNSNGNNFDPISTTEDQKNEHPPPMVDDEDDEKIELPLAPLSPPPVLPPTARRPSTENGNTNRTLKVKEMEVIKLKNEIESETGVRVIVPTEAAIKGLALVEIGGKIWISGWNIKYKILSAGFHVGDQLLAIDKRSVPPTINETKSLLNALAFSGPVEFFVKRLPYGKTYFMERNVQGKKLGLIRKKAKNEIIEIEPNSIAERSGMTLKTNSFLNPMETVNWFITEVNGHPLNFFSKSNEAGYRLDSVGLEVTVVVQPVDFVKMLKKALKQQKKNYKEYVIG